MADKQRLVLSIIDFLNQSGQDGSVKQDDKESLDIASTSNPIPNQPTLTNQHRGKSNVSVKRLA